MCHPGRPPGKKAASALRRVLPMSSSGISESGPGTARRAEWPGMTEGPDRWHRWLLDTRFGGDAACRERDLTEFLYPVRDTVLDRARLRPGATLLDVGTGDGLIAFGALERLGPSGRVI